MKKMFLVATIIVVCFLMACGGTATSEDQTTNDANPTTFATVTTESIDTTTIPVVVDEERDELVQVINTFFGEGDMDDFSYSINKNVVIIGEEEMAETGSYGSRYSLVYDLDSTFLSVYNETKTLTGFINCEKNDFKTDGEFIFRYNIRNNEREVYKSVIGYYEDKDLLFDKTKADYLERTSFYVPSYSSVERGNDGNYNMTYSLKDFLTYDPELAEELLVPEELITSDYQMRVNIMFDLDNTIGFNYNSDYFYTDVDSVQKQVYINIYEGMEFQTPFDPIVYESNSIFTVFSTAAMFPEFCITTHEGTYETFSTIFQAEDTGYIKFYFEPGFYGFSSAGIATLFRENITWLDSELNPLSFFDDLRITEAGFYYLSVLNNTDEPIETDVFWGRYSETDLGSIENPNLVTNIIDDVLGTCEINVYFLTDNSPINGYIQLTIGEVIDDFRVISNLGIIDVTGNQTIIIPIQVGDVRTTAILGGSYENQTLDIQIDFIAYDLLETEYSEMPEIAVGENTVTASNPDYETNYKLAIDTAGNYNFTDYIYHFNSRSTTQITFELYTIDNVLVGSDLELDSVYLDAGSYYLKIVCNDIQTDVIVDFNIVKE